MCIGGDWEKDGDIYWQVEVLVFVLSLALEGSEVLKSCCKAKLVEGRFDI